MIPDEDLKVISLNQADRHHSYDLVQKLTFLVISTEFVICGYVLLNTEKLFGMRYLSTLFLVGTLAGQFGILWRFCYNQTYHENVHAKRSGFHGFCHFVQILSYWVYVLLTTIFFIGSTMAAYTYVAKTEHGNITRQRDPDDVANFFRNGRRFGSSPDYALVKQGVLDSSQWDHVATFHGLYDDFKACKDAATCLSSTGGDKWDCMKLNE